MKFVFERDSDWAKNAKIYSTFEDLDHRDAFDWKMYRMGRWTKLLEFLNEIIEIYNVSFEGAVIKDELDL